MTNIFARLHHRLDSRIGNEIHLPKYLDRKDSFYHKAVTQKAFVNTKFIYSTSKPQSNKSVPKRLDGYVVKIRF